MAERVFTKDTMLDLVVNIIPLSILAFFIGLFVIWGPFDWDPLYSTLMLGIIGGSFLLLAVLTYVSALAIRGDEIEREAAEAAAAEAGAPTDAAADGAGAGDPDAADDEDDALGHELETAPSSETTPAETDTETDDDGETADDGDDGEYEEVF